MMDASKYTKFNDYKVDGNIDWTAYRKAQTENGEICSKCRSHITFAKGHETACRDCDKLENDDGEVWSDNYIRCPKCSVTWQPYEREHYELLEDGSHDVTCQNCDHDFTVSTSISWTFNSPPKIQEEDNGEKDEANKGSEEDSGSD